MTIIKLDLLATDYLPPTVRCVVASYRALYKSI